MLRSSAGAHSFWCACHDGGIIGSLLIYVLSQEELCRELGSTHSPHIQVVPFKTIDNVDVLFGNETVATTFNESEGWEEKDVTSIAKQLAAPKNGRPAWR